MADTSSKSAVLLALAGNAFLTVIKFVAFGFSRSGSMFSEAMHSLADTANQALLFLGIRRSERRADAKFHYGYGGERFLFALLSAVGIFVLGCGVTVYHGVSSLLDPHDLQPSWIDFVVLGIAFCVDGFVLLKALSAINKQRGDKGLIQFLRTTTDPTISAVLLEDAVACIGVLVAVTGILLAWWTGNPVFDALGSIVIGALMGLIAVFLGYRNRSLILGQAMPAEMQQEAIEFLESQPTVESVRAVQSLIIGANSFKLKAEVDWDGRVLAERYFGWIEEHKEMLDTKEGREEFAREFGELITEAVAEEIDRIEKELFKRWPNLTWVDLESD